MKKIILVGNINVFDEQIQRTKSEISLDIYPEDEIVYPDLVFTLKEKGKDYFRPIVCKEKYGLYIVSNPLFFRAAKEAGIKEIKFDLLFNNSLQLEQIMEDYNLRFPTKPKREKFIDRMLFFSDTLKYVPKKDKRVRLNSKNSSSEYVSNQCIRYKKRINNENVISTYRSQIEFIDYMIKENGPLRSIDGLIKKVGGFKKYFN